MLHGFGPVNGDMDGRRGVLQPVGDGGSAFHPLNGFAQLSGGILQILHVIAVDFQGDAVTGHITHHGIRRAGGFHLALHVFAQCLDGGPGLVAALSLRQCYIGRHIIAAAAAAGEHACAHAGAGGHHGAHGFHIFYGHSPAHNLVCQCHRRLPVAAFRHGNGQVHRVHVNVRHEGEAPGHGKPRRSHQ